MATVTGPNSHRTAFYEGKQRERGLQTNFLVVLEKDMLDFGYFLIEVQGAVSAVAGCDSTV